MSKIIRTVVIPGTLADELGAIALRALSRHLRSRIEVASVSRHHAGKIYDEADLGPPDTFRIAHWLQGRP